jgi:beta-N-acetylhexosaminidase
VPKILVVALTLLLLTPAAVPQPKAAKATPAEAWVASTLKSMTLDEKIGQMVMPQMEGAFSNFGSEHFRIQLARVKSLNVGGLIVFRGTPVDTAAMLNELQRNSKIPLLIAGDLERGTASQFPGYAVSLPSNLGIGATGNASYAAFAGSVTAKEARSVGYHMAFAPVADVNNNPDNPIINIRSFGEDPEMVAKMVAAYVSAAEAQDLLTTAKHFPGHGDTATDSHLDLGVVTGDRERLDRVELVPFRAAIKAGVGAIMTAHLAVPAIEPDTTLPATMSPKVLNGLLRQQLGFHGLIVTDALDMGAVTSHYWDGEVVLRSVEAGADILLMPPDSVLAIRVLREAVKSGRIKESRIDESVERILRAKAKLGLHENRFVDLAKIGTQFGDPGLQQTAEDIASASMTLLRDTRGALPLDLSKRQHVVIVIVNADDEPQGAHFVWEARQRLEDRDLDVLVAGPNITPQQSAATVEKAAQADVILAAVYVKIAAKKGTAGLPAAHLELLGNLARLNKRMMTISFGNPYLLRDLPDTPGYLCAYSSAEVSERAAIHAAFGEILPLRRGPRETESKGGKLPVTIPASSPENPPLAVRGSGEPIAYLPMTLGTDTAAQDTRFKKAFSIIEKANAAHGFPGAVLAVGHKGKVVALKAFGKMDYSPNAAPVGVDGIWDMASCSKVVVTTTLAAMMIEQKMLQLDMPVRAYIPEFGVKDPSDPKNKVTVRQLMMHSSGLPAYEKYFLTSKNRAEIMQKIYDTPLANPPGTKSVYSDFGIILLGEILQRITGYPLNVMARTTIFEPLAMHSSMYNPPADLLPRIPPTEDDKEFRKKVVHGEVHDENAWVMGGVSGHAGLFSSAGDLATFAQMMLNGGIYAHKRLLKRSTVELITTRQNEPPGTTRALGWDTPSPDGHSSAGHLLSPHAFGHTGFTGTSIWIDPDKELFIILLTNRVHPTRDTNVMIQVRPQVADAVVEALSGK